jgi:hypothetical protein
MPDLNGRVESLNLKGIYSFFKQEFKTFSNVKGLEPLATIPELAKDKDLELLKIFLIDRRPRPKL